jgi:hypothetical protein
MGLSDARLVDFAQARVNRIAEAIGGLAEQIKLTNSHVERLNRELGELRDIRNEVIPQANQIINAQQQAMRAMLPLDDIERRPDEPTS